MNGPRLAQLVDAIASVEEIPCCDCGHDYSAHTYWEDRIYDINGRRCPKSVTGSEYRYSHTQTARSLRARRIEVAGRFIDQSPAARELGCADAAPTLPDGEVKEEQ